MKYELLKGKTNLLLTNEKRINLNLTSNRWEDSEEIAKKNEWKFRFILFLNENFALAKVAKLFVVSGIT